MIDELEKMLAAGQDSALLRFSLGSAYLKQENFEQAVFHLQHAVQQNPEYSAAWKIYGKALVGLGKLELASKAYIDGILIAEKKGDVQAAKEMKVFLKRVNKAQQTDSR